MTTSAQEFAMLPNPSGAASLDDLVEQLRRLKAWAGNPSYETIKGRVNAAWTAAGRPARELVSRSTVAYCFRPGRRRMDADLVVAVVHALHPDTGYVTAWRQALRVVDGEIEAVSQVRVRDRLPPEPTWFTGRTDELDRIRHAGQDEHAVAVVAIEGMAGVGKTELAVRAGHLLHRQQPFERVLFVNVRGFDPDPAQPPADPAAVLDGFLRLLGMPGQRIPHDLAGRTAAYRDHLAGIRALVVLDNAASTEQVRPLLATLPGCLTLITSRRRLTGLRSAVHLPVDVFTPDEALAFLTRAVPDAPMGPDPHAAARIARRCDYLPLALSLTTGHISGTPGWTLTDHADRLDERHHQRRLDAGVEVALHLSYQHLPADQRRTLRLLALHPGQDFDAYAAAAIVGTDPTTVRADLDRLHRDHLLQQAVPGRYSFHDLVRAYATTQATDEDRPAARRAALTRLFDYYLTATAAAVNSLHPFDAHLRPHIGQASTHVPCLTGRELARGWLDSERPTLIAVAAHAAAHGWPAHTARLSRILFGYLDGGYLTDALAIHGCALQTDDPTAKAHARLGLGGVLGQLGRLEQATDQLRQALRLYRRNNDLDGQARACTNLGVIDRLRGRYPSAIAHLKAAHRLYRRAGNRIGEAYPLICLGDLELQQGRYGLSTGYLDEALRLSRETGNLLAEASTLDSLGMLFLRLGQPTEATKRHQAAGALYEQIGHREGRVFTYNGLGEAAQAAGRPDIAFRHHTAAHTLAVETGARVQQARAHTGLGHAHRARGNRALARRHYRHAFAIHIDLGLPGADQIRAHLTALGI
ncbi:tetratricopeptide repeat protein [Catenuloplanes atrovinosus]|uniref:Tetratricopeptide (TPR) repeat protein n=1 Tax=Catenuloplanes atrovinosus TaxID=137266 RepID=A0AAE4C9K0_9ACTN|nr:tetratricopeptide repeat protein [Catenuloplanes atrovinosus]MDR7276626.1 tetratricopeptide (TPR) repeat protein [Catenuloplanes atrovinosus]